LDIGESSDALALGESVQVVVVYIVEIELATCEIWTFAADCDE
jgi:hypothetical protein